MNKKKMSKIPNGTYTLINRATQTYVTLKIETVQKGKLKDRRIISRLNGPDNVRNYQGIAFVNDDDTVSIWRKHQNHKTSQTVRILRDLAIYGIDSRYALTVQKRLSMSCVRCNRKLTTPQSIKDGIGPECIKKMGF